MPSLADIPDQLLDPEEPEQLVLWAMTLPGTVIIKMQLMSLYERQTGARIPGRLWRALHREERRHNG